MAANCVFCQVVNGEQDADFVHAGEDLVAFLHIVPVNRGHTLLVSREHYPNITTLPAERQGRMMVVGQEIGRALMRAVDADGFDLHVTNGRCAGQVVMHAHMHIIPRYPEDGVVFPVRSVGYPENGDKTQLIEDTQKRLRL